MGKTLYGYKLLVVDDSEAMCLLAQALLKDVVSEVRYCTDPRAALELWARWRPRVVLLDYEMPALDGIFFATALRRLESEVGARSILLMVTGHVSRAVVEAAGGAGCDGFIPKPLTAEKVIAQIERITHTTPFAAATPAPICEARRS